MWRENKISSNRGATDLVSHLCGLSRAIDTIKSSNEAASDWIEKKAASQLFEVLPEQGTRLQDLVMSRVTVTRDVVLPL